MLNLPSILIKYILSFDEKSILNFRQTCKKMRKIFESYKIHTFSILKDNSVISYFLNKKPLKFKYFLEYHYDPNNVHSDFMEISFGSYMSENELYSKVINPNFNLLGFLKEKAVILHLKEVDFARSSINFNHFKNLKILVLNRCSINGAIKTIDCNIEVLYIIDMYGGLTYPKSLKTLHLISGEISACLTAFQPYLEKVVIYCKSHRDRMVAELIKTRISEKLTIKY